MPDISNHLEDADPPISDPARAPARADRSRPAPKPEKRRDAMTTPARYLSPEQMTVEQLIRHQRGEQVENPDYVTARNATLEAAGLEPDAATETAVADMTVEQHLNRIRRNH